MNDERCWNPLSTLKLIFLMTFRLWNALPLECKILIQGAIQHSELMSTVRANQQNYWLEVYAPLPGPSQFAPAVHQNALGFSLHLLSGRQPTQASHRVPTTERNQHSGRIPKPTPEPNRRHGSRQRESERNLTSEGSMRRCCFSLVSRSFARKMAFL